MKPLRISSENVRNRRKSSGSNSTTVLKKENPIPERVIPMDKKPDAKFRAGQISATVWTNQGQTKDGNVRTFSSVSFEKSYKDKEGAWKTTKSLNVQDLPKASLVLTKAYEHLALRDLTEEDPQISEEAV